MNEQDLQYFKDKLEAELADLTKQFSAMGRQLNEAGDWIVTPQPIDQETPEFDEIADTIEEFEGDIAVLNVLEKRYTEVQNALERIEAGTYGTCQVSGEPIERERLEANPAATTAIAHKETDE